MAEIKSLPSNQAYRENYERLFGPEKLTVVKERKARAEQFIAAKIAEQPVHIQPLSSEERKQLKDFFEIPIPHFIPTRLRFKTSTAHTTPKRPA